MIPPVMKMMKTASSRLEVPIGSFCSRRHSWVWYVRKEIPALSCLIFSYQIFTSAVHLLCDEPGYIFLLLPKRALAYGQIHVLTEVCVTHLGENNSQLIGAGPFLLIFFVHIFVASSFVQVEESFSVGV